MQTSKLDYFKTGVECRNVKSDKNLHRLKYRGKIYVIDRFTQKDIWVEVQLYAMLDLKVADVTYIPKEIELIYNKYKEYFKEYNGNRR